MGAETDQSQKFEIIASLRNARGRFPDLEKILWIFPNPFTNP